LPIEEGIDKAALIEGLDFIVRQPVAKPHDDCDQAWKAVRIPQHRKLVRVSRRQHQVP